MAKKSTKKTAKKAVKKTARKVSKAKKTSPAKKRTPAKKKSPKKGASSKTNKLGVKNSLVNNINARKKKGITRPKKKSKISRKAYGRMKQNWK